MPKVSFLLKRPKSTSMTVVMLVYTCSNGRLKYYTGENVLPSQWPLTINKGTRTVLNRIQDHVENFIIDCKIKNQPVTTQALKESLDKLIKRRVAGVNYFEKMNAIVDDMEAGKILTPASKRYSPGSLKTLRFTIRFLKTFEPKMTPESVTIDMYKRFIGFCQNLNYSTNYIGSQIKNWKSLGKLVGGTDIYDNKNFKKIKEDTNAVFLDESELELIFRHGPLIPKHEAARDIFILGCYTGLRISDLKLLSKKNFDDNFIYVANEKTDSTVVIPMHPIVKEILKKYKGQPPYVHESDINEIIKGVAKRAGITKMTLSSITKGGKRVDKYLQKWELISLHTGRRSMVTNLRKNGVPDSIVMKLCGITSPNTLKKYDKLTSEEAASIAAGLKFFK